jgi:hypothetical protein
MNSQLCNVRKWVESGHSAEAGRVAKSAALGFLGHIEYADEAGDHDREVKQSGNNLEGGDASRQVRTRQEVAVTERRQCDEAEKVALASVNSSGPLKLPGELNSMAE